MTDDGRPFARIWRDIFNDSDFLALPPNAKLVYLLLIIGEYQGAGLMTLTIARWAGRLNMTKDDVLVALRELDTARFIALDEETEELLVRTAMRNDTFVGGSWKNHKGALTYCLNALSPYIRSVLASEIGKLRPQIGHAPTLAYMDEVLAQLEGGG
ncbi:MAG: hypothetical protein CK431_21320 [Mycobacterium sp.]|nr:MAG: hypothetical protein CK431_21320 [Mycobacterium sp.]